MRSMNRSFIAMMATLVIVLSTFSSASFATTLYASVSKNKVVKNEVFQLRIVADEKASADDIQFDQLGDDFVFGRPSFGSSFNMINGSSSRRSEWNVSLAANKLGSLVIPSFELNGAKTQPITIQVSMDQQAPEQADLVEMLAYVERDSLYPNESTYLNTRLVIKANPRRLQNPQVIPPSTQGVELTLEGEANQYQSVLDGVEVTVVEQKFRVTAKDSGTFTIHGPRFKGALAYNGNGGGTRLIPIETPTKTFTLTVADKPAGYQGVWLPTSQLSLNQTWHDMAGQTVTEPTFKTKVGESLTREITLIATGLTADQLPDLSIINPDSVREYAEKPMFEILDNGDVRMSLKQVIIPKQTGEITLPEVKVNWWNTQTKSQETATVKGLLLIVEQGEANNQTATVAPTAPTKAETITVNDAGFWPYVAGLLALFWIATLGYVWHLKRVMTQDDIAPPRAQNNVSSDAFVKLQHAFTQRDGVKLNYALQQWIAFMHIEGEEKAQLEQTADAFNQSLYKNGDSSWDVKALEVLVERIQKRQVKGTQDHNASLAQL